MIYTLTMQEVAAAHRAYAARFGRPAPAPFANTPDPDRRLRIGMLSGDFRQHPVGYFLEAAITAHQRAGFHLTAYDVGKRADAIAAVERNGLSDAERATLVELEASMRSQVTVLEDVAAGSTYDATMIGEYVINQAATVSTVKTSTYALGVGIGLLISVLVLLQMAVLYERRQRTTAR